MASASDAAEKTAYDQVYQVVQAPCALLTHSVVFTHFVSQMQPVLVPARQILEGKEAMSIAALNKKIDSAHRDVAQAFLPWLSRWGADPAVITRRIQVSAHKLKEREPQGCWTCPPGDAGGFHRAAVTPGTVKCWVLNSSPRAEVSSSTSLSMQTPTSSISSSVLDILG